MSFVHSMYPIICVFFAVVLFASISVLIAFVKPYKRTYMNIVDTLLLGHLALLCLLVSTPFENNSLFALCKVILSLIPLIVFLLYHALSLICKLKRFTMFKKCLSCECCPRRADNVHNNTHTCAEHQRPVSYTHLTLPTIYSV